MMVWTVLIFSSQSVDRNRSCTHRPVTYVQLQYSFLYQGAVMLAALSTFVPQSQAIVDFWNLLLNIS